MRFLLGAFFIFVLFFNGIHSSSKQQEDRLDVIDNLILRIPSASLRKVLTPTQENRAARLEKSFPKRNLKRESSQENLGRKRLVSQYPVESEQEGDRSYLVATRIPHKSPRIETMLNQKYSAHLAQSLAQRNWNRDPSNPHAGLTLAERQIASQHHSQYQELYNSKIASRTHGRMYQSKSIHPSFQVPLGYQTSHQSYGHDQHTLYSSWNPHTNYHQSGPQSSTSGKDPPETQDLLGTMFRNSPSRSNLHETYVGHNQNQKGPYGGSGSDSGSGSGYHK